MEISSCEYRHMLQDEIPARNHTYPQKVTTPATVQMVYNMELSYGYNKLVFTNENNFQYRRG